MRASAAAAGACLPPRPSRGARSARSSPCSSPTSSASRRAPSGSTPRTCARCWRRTTRALRDELERFGGTVEKFIGDAVMALFGAPVAHEDDPERAVRAALAIRDWARERGRLQVRIAVNTGEALVTSRRAPGRGRGDGRRRRGQHRGPPAGGSPDERHPRRRADATARRGDAIDYRERRARRGEGEGGAGSPSGRRSRRARAFGVASRRARRRSSAASASSTRCVDAFERVRERARGRSSSRSSASRASARAGSSHELFATSRREPEFITWRQGRSLPYGEGVSFWALGEIVKAQAGILESDSPAEVGRKLRDAVAALVPSRRARLGRGATSARSSAWRRRAAAATSGSEAFAAWRRFFEALAERGRSCSSSRICTGPTTSCSTSSTTSSSGRRRAAPRRRARPGPSCSSGGRLGWRQAQRDSRSRSRRCPTTRRRGSSQRYSARPPRAEDAGGRCSSARTAIRCTRSSSHACSTRAERDGAPDTVQGIIAARLDVLPPRRRACSRRPRSSDGVLARRRSTRAEERLRSLLGGRSSFGVSGAARWRDEEEYSFAHVLVRDVAYGQIPARTARRSIAAPPPGSRPSRPIEPPTGRRWWLITSAPRWSSPRRRAWPTTGYGARRARPSVTPASGLPASTHSPQPSVTSRPRSSSRRTTTRSGRVSCSRSGSSSVRPTTRRPCRCWTRQKRRSRRPGIRRPRHRRRSSALEHRGISAAAKGPMSTCSAR